MSSSLAFNINSLITLKESLLLKLEVNEISLRNFEDEVWNEAEVNDLMQRMSYFILLFTLKSKLFSNFLCVTEIRIDIGCDTFAEQTVGKSHAQATVILQTLQHHQFFDS